MSDFSKQDVVDDQYYISTAGSIGTEGKKFLSTVFGYHNKKVMWAKIYKQVYYATLKEAEEGHKQLKKDYAD